MSKSKKNTIDPEKMIKIYGADAVRLFIYLIVHLKKIFNGLKSGMSSSFKFIQKFWLLSKNNNFKLIKKEKNDQRKK